MGINVKHCPASPSLMCFTFSLSVFEIYQTCVLFFPLALPISVRRAVSLRYTISAVANFAGTKA